MAESQSPLRIRDTAGLRRSPAAHLADSFAAASSADVALREIPFRTMVGLRVLPGADAAARVESALGLLLPCRVGTVSASDAARGISVLWLAPDEFLVVADGDAPGTAPDELTALLAEALDDAPGAAVDLSANRTTFRLEGRAARDVLEKGCPLDLHPRVFVTGAAFVTRLGPVPVVVHRVGADAYDVLPRASFADYLGRWLVDAMAEFAAPGPR